MSDRLRIDIDDLGNAAPVFHRQSDALAAALASLHTKLANLGTPWGDDAQGSGFHAQYGPAKEGVDTAVGILVDGLESIADGLKAMANNHDENELATKDMFDKAAGSGQ